MIAAVVSLGGLAFVLAIGLGIASKIFAIEIDPKVAAINEILPGANCGGCGYPGCSGFAEALVAGKINPSECKASGSEAIEEMSSILGVTVEQKEKTIATIFCQGTLNKCKPKYQYEGIEDCKAALLLGDGYKACPYSCLGLGSCVKACPFKAIKIEPTGLPSIDENRCTGCGSCVSQCPQGVIKLVPVSKLCYIPCSSNDKGKAVRQACEVGCLACGLCVKKCPEQAITMENNCPVIDPEKCTGCGTCAEKCPRKIIRIQIRK